MGRCPRATPFFNGDFSRIRYSKGKNTLTFAMFKAFGLVLSLVMLPNIAVCLPPPEDIPEEILRAEIITEGRSPKDGSPVTASEYAEIQLEQEERNLPPNVNEDIQHTIFLLRVLKLFKTLKPF